MPRILIIVPAMRGRTSQMVAPICEGIQSTGVETLTRTVADVTWDEMCAADGMVIGNPTRFGGVDWEIKRLFDVMTIQGFPGPLAGKVGGAFTAGGQPGSGAELAMMSTLHLLLNHGMVIQGSAFSAHYGPVFLRTSTDEAMQKECRTWGQLWAQLVQRLATGTPGRP